MIIYKLYEEKTMSFQNYFFYFQICYYISYQLKIVKNKCESFYLPSAEMHVCVNGKLQQNQTNNSFKHPLKVFLEKYLFQKIGIRKCS